MTTPREYGEECKHGLAVGTCSLCSEQAEGTKQRSTPRAAGAPSKLATPADVEKYRSRYPGDREETFDAYVEVFFFRLPAARHFPGGWTKFSRCANAEPALVASEPALVRGAEELMRAAGYEPDESGRARGYGRRWVMVRWSEAR